MEAKFYFSPLWMRNLWLLCACCLAGNLRAEEVLPRSVVLVHTDARPDYTGLSQEDYLHLAAFVDPQGRPVDTLFDGFLLFGVKTPSGDGLVPDFGKPIQPADFDWFLDHLFDEGKQLAHLEAAVASLPASLRQTKQIIVGIPYPAVADLPEKRLALARHFMEEAARRFAQAHFVWLHLNGFYWVQETIEGQDPALVKAMAKTLHDHQYEFYWIPYFDSEGQPDWRAFGFDCAMLQPNYAYRNVTPARFNEIDAKRRKLGLMVEMEIAGYTRNRPESPAWKDSFLKYISAGLEHHWADLDCLGYYRGNDLAKMSRQPGDYPYYALMHQFIKHSATPADVGRLAADAATQMAHPVKK